jgi:hypothetical protein
VGRAVRGLGLVLLALALAPQVLRAQAQQRVQRRLDAVGPATNVVICNDVRLPGLDAGLASWQTVGGCGAGASTGTAGGIKWIGRNVRGGLVHVECQASYVDMPYGYNFVGTSLVSYALDDQWSLGVGVPYLFKYMNDPYKVGVDLANKGPGDVSLLGTRRFGATRATAATLTVGLPTGTNDVAYKMEQLWQDRQLGLGEPTAALTIDHIIDNLWGPIVLGGVGNWRGGENEYGSSRAPTATAYSYFSYLLGPFVPAAGVSLTGFFGTDRDRGQPQAVPRASLAGNLSLEWSTDWLALLVGASLPADFAVHSETVPTHNRLGAWTLTLGAAFAPF